MEEMLRFFYKKLWILNILFAIYLIFYLDGRPSIGVAGQNGTAVNLTCTNDTCLNEGNCTTDGGNGTLIQCSCRSGWTGERCERDVCSLGNHVEIDDITRGIHFTTENATTVRGRCDKNLSLGWYRFTSGVGWKMPQVCPAIGQCGAEFPMWLNDSYPENDTFGHEAKMCIHFPVNRDDACCLLHMTIEIKMCKSYAVYKLDSTVNCDASFCVGLETPCENDTESETGFTPCTKMTTVEHSTTMGYITETPGPQHPCTNTTLCQNGGTCDDGVGNYTGNYTCLCPATHTGLHCESEVNTNPPPSNVGMIVGIIIGSLLLVVILVLVGILIFKKKSRLRVDPQKENVLPITPEPSEPSFDETTLEKKN
ncbi:unnamed protein product [Owenia fusiformis]|uniref:Uncharacterized protein n=1 Tax=Owenia fusiformis TaxID=6347 RepID=A0A8J1T7E6_OWEFU|nr:unnamed protein product [Owenia fusiformis]